MKKVLYITYDGLTDPLGQSQVLPYLQQLAEKGYAFTILSFEKKDRFFMEGAVVQAIVDAVGIIWQPLFFTARPPVLSKIWDRYRMRKTALELYKTGKFDLVHCRSYVAAEIGLLLKQRFGVKMLFDMRGFWADEKVDNGQWDLKKRFYKWLYHFYKKKEAAFLLQADGIVSLTQTARNYLLQQPQYKHLSIEVIPCCADLKHFDYNILNAEVINVVKQKLNIPQQDKVLTYLGSVGGWYMTREMFRFFQLLQQRRPDYFLLILTKDAASRVVQDAIEAGIPAEKVAVTYAARKDLPLYLSLSDYSIFFIRNTFSKIASSPTKHAELMGMGIPVICNDVGDTGNIITATQSGILMNNFADSDLINGITALEQVHNWDKAKIRNCAKAIFDLETGAEKYRALYERLCDTDSIQA